MKTLKSTRKRVKKSNPPTKRSDLRSGFEMKVLKSLTSQGVSFTYESEKMEYIVPSTKRVYTPDFIVTTNSGKTLYIEAKGVFDRDTRVKMLLVCQQNPEKDIRILFMRNNKILKGSKTTYTKWCDDRGIPCAVSATGTVPEDWLEE